MTTNKLDLSNLDDVLTSTDKAKGLPNQHYVDQEVFEEEKQAILFDNWSAIGTCLLYTSPSPRDRSLSRMPSSA